MKLSMVKTGLKECNGYKIQLDILESHSLMYIFMLVIPMIRVWGVSLQAILKKTMFLKKMVGYLTQGNLLSVSIQY